MTSGTTGGSLGSYIDTTRGNSYFCISTTACSPRDFTNNVDYSGGNGIIGVTLVRIAGNDVPEPGSFALVGLAGFAAFMTTRRRKT